MMSSDGLDSYGLDEFNINQDWFNEYKSATPDPNEGDLSLNVPLNDEQNAIYSIPPTQESYGSEFSSRIPSSQISEFAEPSPYQQQQPAQFETLQRLQPYETAQPCSSAMSESQISHNQSSSQIPSSMQQQQTMEHFSYIPYETSSYVNYIPTSSQQGLSYEVTPSSQQPSIQQLDQPPGQQPNIRYDTEWLPSSQYQQISTQGSGPITYTVMSSASSSQPQTSNPPQMQVMDSSYVQPQQPSYIQDGNQVLLTQMQTIQRQDPPQIVQHQLQSIPQNSVDSISYQPQMIYQNGPSVPSQSIQVIDGCQYISQDASSQSSFQTVQVLSSNAPPTIQQQQQPMQQTPTTSVRVSTTTAPRSRAKPASRSNGKKKPMVGDIKVIEQKVQEQGKVEVQVSLETSDEISRLTTRLMEIQKLESENGANYSNEKKDIEAKLLSLFLGQQAPPAPTSAVDTSLQSQNPPAAPKRTSSSSRSRPKKTVAQLKQEAAAQVQEVQQQQPQLSNQPNAFIQQPPPIVTPKAPPKRLPPTSKQPQPPTEVATDMNNITYSSMGQPQIIYQHSTTPSTSYGQPASVSVHYTSNMKQVPMSGELISLPPGSISGLPFQTQPGQRIYVIQNTTKAETFDSIQAQPITTTVVPKETKPPPKRRRPPPKPKPPKGLPIHDFDSPTTSIPQQIILVPPVELAKKIAEKQKERTSNLSNYFESLKESLDHLDYVSPFKNLSDVVQRLLPFSFLRESDLSDEFLDKVDHEILRHTIYMNERKRHIETKVRNILYKEALPNQSTDPELCMLLALDNEYDERQLNNDRPLFEQNRDQYIHENGVPTFNANLDKNSIDEARAKLGPIKIRQLQYKYREFDPSIYLGNIEEALAMKSPYIGSRRTSLDLETTYDESLVDDTESVVSMEMKAYVDHHVFPMNSPPGISSLRMEIGQYIPTEVSKRIEPVKVEENRVNEPIIHVIEPEASPPKALPTLNEQPMIMPTIEDVIPPIINGFYSKEEHERSPRKSTKEALKVKEHENFQKIKISLKTKFSQMTSKFVEEGETLKSKEMPEEIDMKPMKSEKISPIKIRPFEQEVIEDRPPISRNASVEDPNMSKEKTVVKRSCYGLDLSDEDEDEEKRPSTSEAPVMPIKLKILKSALQKESENTQTRKEDKKRHEKRKEKHEKRRHKHREKENRTSNHNHLEHNLPIKEEISLEKPVTIVPKLVIPRARLGINALTQPDQDLHVNDIKPLEESYPAKDQHFEPKSHKRHLREHHKSKEEKAERKKKKKKKHNDGISMDNEKPKVPRIKIKFGGDQKKWATTVDSSSPRDVVMDHREDLVLSPDVPTALPVFTPPHTNTSSINTPPSDTFSNERNNGTPIGFDLRARVQFSPCSDESDDEKRCRLSNLVLSRLKKQ